MDICTRFHSYSLFRAFSSPCVSVNTLSLSRVDTVISRSGSPHDASHLSSIKCKQCKDVSTLPQKYSPLVKENSVNLKCATH